MKKQRHSVSIFITGVPLAQVDALVDCAESTGAVVESIELTKGEPAQKKAAKKPISRHRGYQIRVKDKSKAATAQQVRVATALHSVCGSNWIDRRTATKTLVKAGVMPEASGPAVISRLIKLGAIEERSPQ